MITLINANRMSPPIGPVGLDYVGSTLAEQGFEVDLLDLCMTANPEAAFTNYFQIHSPELVGISCRNVDDCFWPSATWFAPDIKQLIDDLRRLTEAPIVLGGVGFSAFAESMVRFTGADFGIRGDGERALASLILALRAKRKLDGIAGLIRRIGHEIIATPPDWIGPLDISTKRNFIDNAAYFNKGGQCGFETKRGCPRQCSYCADPVAKGRSCRLRDPKAIAEELTNLLAQGVDVFHTCDAEFNIPYDHAAAVCEELIRQNLADKIRWYAYLEITPFDRELATLMRQAGCVGIDFTADSAHPDMLRTYAKHHSPADIETAVWLCRESGITVMLDLLLGGPGETPQTAKTTIDFVKRINPDSIGAGLGMRLYPDTPIVETVSRQGLLEKNSAIYRKYSGPIDLFQPTFYISPALGDRPDQLIHDLIDNDPRFFPPMMFTGDNNTPAGDHNYNDNLPLLLAIEQGHRGAYWDILRKLK